MAKTIKTVNLAPWYTTQAGVTQALAFASAHWQAGGSKGMRNPASHRWLAAAAWVAGAGDANACHAAAAAAALTMGWPVNVVPPVAFCRANHLYASRMGWPYASPRPAPLGKVVATPVAATA